MSGARRVNRSMTTGRTGSPSQPPLPTAPRKFSAYIEILTHVADRGNVSPPIEQRLQFQLRLDPALLDAGVGHYAPVRVVDKTAPRVIMRRVLAAAVDADDVGQVLDRARLEQRHPVVVAHGRPTGDDDDQVCAPRGRPA